MLSEQFGVSKSTLRDAINTLTSEGLLVRTPGTKSGTSVTAPSKHEVVNFLKGTLSLLTDSAGMSVDELLEARELLEVRAARMAAQKRSDDEYSSLLTTVPEPRPRDRLLTYDLNRRFHIEVIGAAGNRFLVMMAEPLFHTLQTRLILDEASDQFWQMVFEDHAAVVEAIGQRDPDLAGEAMAQHVANLRPTYQEAVKALKD